MLAIDNVIKPREARQFCLGYFCYKDTMNMKFIFTMEYEALALTFQFVISEMLVRSSAYNLLIKTTYVKTTEREIRKLFESVLITFMSILYSSY